MAHDGCEFQYLKVRFGTVKSDLKLKAGIFAESKIREYLIASSEVNWIYESW